MRSLSIFMLIFTVFALSRAEAATITPIDRARSEIVKRLAQDPELKDAGFTAGEIKELFADIEVMPKRKGRHIDNAELRRIYRKIFLNEAGYTRGREYMKAHAAELALAEETYGVSREVLAAILWVETGFGKGLGDHPTLAALFSETVRAIANGADPKKIAGWEGQLKAFLLLTRKLALDPQSILGSYAGALGIPQFMPYSYRAFAVDGDNDGKIDLFHSHADAIMSTANYLAKNGFAKSARQAVFAYNHSKIYVDIVLEYAEKIKN
ncbi:MAG: lytic murein transglycosylase [Candidatus Niyogibacteria bacterium]|nr:lytic murein transglycosylase [Candidatus Niyogibacteria bacterium]